MKVKNYLLGFVALGAIAFTSCEKEEVSTVGNIPGMGADNYNEAFEIKANTDVVSLNEGIVINSIKGAGNSPFTITAPADLQFPSQDESSTKAIETEVTLEKIGYFGCTGFPENAETLLMPNVRITLSITNTKDHILDIFADKVVIPQGSIWKNMDGTSQHGILLQQIAFYLGEGETKEVTIDLFCLNEGMPTSNEGQEYKSLGVTSNPIMLDFLNTLGWANINYEWWLGYYSDEWAGVDPWMAVFLEPFDKLEEIHKITYYISMANRLQNMIWKITDRGEQLSNSDKEFIKRIPEVPVGNRIIVKY